MASRNEEKSSTKQANDDASGTRDTQSHCSHKVTVLFVQLSASLLSCRAAATVITCCLEQEG